MFRYTSDRGQILERRSFAIVELRGSQCRLVVPGRVAPHPRVEGTVTPAAHAYVAMRFGSAATPAPLQLLGDDCRTGPRPLHPGHEPTSDLPREAVAAGVPSSHTPPAPAQPRIDEVDARAVVDHQARRRLPHRSRRRTVRRRGRLRLEGSRTPRHEALPASSRGPLPRPTALPPVRGRRRYRHREVAPMRPRSCRPSPVLVARVRRPPRAG